MRRRVETCSGLPRQRRLARGRPEPHPCPNRWFRKRKDKGGCIMQARTKGFLIGGLTALVLTGVVAMSPQPVSAGSIEHRGDFGGSWTYIGPGDNYRVR